MLGTMRAITIRGTIPAIGNKQFRCQPDTGYSHRLGLRNPLSPSPSPLGRSGCCCGANMEWAQVVRRPSRSRDSLGSWAPDSLAEFWSLLWGWYFFGHLAGARLRGRLD